MCFLVKRHGGWYDLRVKVPADLVDILGRSDISISLETKAKRIAERLLPGYRGRLLRCFDTIRRSGSVKELDQLAIRGLVRSFVKEQIELQTLCSALGKPLNDGAHLEELDALEDFMHMQKEALGTRTHVHFMREQATALASREGYLPAGDGFQLLCMEMLRASIKLSEANRRMLLGETDPHSELTFGFGLGLGELTPQPAPQLAPQPAPSSPSPPPPPAHWPPPAPPSPAPPTLQQLVDTFTQMKMESGKWRSRTLQNHQPKLKALLQVLGQDTPVDQITVEDAREYAKILSLLPPSFFLKGYEDLSGVSSSQLEGKHSQTLDVKSRIEYLNLAKSLFAWGVENEYLEKNPIIKGLIPPKKTQERELRVPFSQEDLQRIFNPKTFGNWSDGSPARYWLPQLCLWAGSRLEETANLHCDDVFKHEESGLWCLDFNFENGRKLKNQNAIRTIPLHPEIAEEFAEYVATVRDPGQPGGGLVFPELAKKVGGRHSHYFSKAFGRYLRVTVGITDKRKVLHSLRHLVTDTLWKAMVPETIIEELTGRAGKTETSRRYAKGYRVETLYQEAILKLNFEIPAP